MVRGSRRAKWMSASNASPHIALQGYRLRSPSETHCDGAGVRVESRIQVEECRFHRCEEGGIGKSVPTSWLLGLRVGEPVALCKKSEALCSNEGCGPRRFIRLGAVKNGMALKGTRESSQVIQEGGDSLGPSERRRKESGRITKPTLGEPGASLCSAAGVRSLLEPGPNIRQPCIGLARMRDNGHDRDDLRTARWRDLAALMRGRTTGARRLDDARL